MLGADVQIISSAIVNAESLRHAGSLLMMQKRRNCDRTWKSSSQSGVKTHVVFYHFINISIGQFVNPPEEQFFDFPAQYSSRSLQIAVAIL